MSRGEQKAAVRPGPATTKLSDVARMAGVSLATASRALNNTSGVAASTRRLVLEAAAEADYVVSPEALRLARGRTGRVAVVVPHLSRWFFGALLEGLESVTRQANLDLLLYQVDGAADRHRFFDRLPARRKVDAVVVLAFPVDASEQDRLELMGVHVIAAGGQDVPYPHVYIDDLAAGRQAMNHLILLGHRRIAMIDSRDPDERVPPTGRREAYFSSMQDAGIQLDPDLVLTARWGSEEAADAMSVLLSLRRPPTALYAHSDELALGAMRTIRRAGLSIPRDLSVVGIDDHPLAALSDLTTVRQPVREQGTLAGRMLVALLRGEEIEQRITLPTRLVVRSSTSPPDRQRSARD